MKTLYAVCMARATRDGLITSARYDSLDAARAAARTRAGERGCPFHVLAVHDTIYPGDFPEQDQTGLFDTDDAP